MKLLSKTIFFIGIFLIFISVVLFFKIFSPVISSEIYYFFSSRGKNVSVVSKGDRGSKNVIVPRDGNFGIVIPKISANAKVIKDVNPFIEKEYQWALTKGVAHAKGSAYPGQFGNVFLFAHSSVNFYEATRYNSIFYLITKLEKGDEIYLFYKKNKIRYTVTGKKIVEAKDVSYLTSLNPKKHILTLMTCWPPGTTIKRLLVIAETVE